MLRCHCRDCQHVTGGACSTIVYVPASAFKITHGTPMQYQTQSIRGGENKRSFCGRCGNPISGAASERGVGIHVATLDDPSWFRSAMDIHVADKQPWDVVDESLPQFEAYPQ
jgi:hypothetical protein